MFFLTDADYTFKNIKCDGLGTDKGEQTTEVPIIRLYGVNKNEQSVMVSLQNFNPYFYIEKPAALLDRHFDDLKELLSVSCDTNSPV